MTSEPNAAKMGGIAEHAADPTAANVKRPPIAWRILVVEDVPSQQKLLVKILTKSGHSVATADSGREAIDHVEREPFDIVLMDVQMPGMNGLDAIRAIRLHEKYTGEHVAIVAVTAHVLSSDVEQCYDAGADAFLPKPINLVDLIAVLKLAAEAHPRREADF
jgi:CheY-like chemotaxis protein